MDEESEQSSAEIEVSKAGGKIMDQVNQGVDAAKQIDHFLSNSGVMAIPRALVSVLGGNWIIAKQVENVIKVQKKLHEFAEKEGVRLDPEDLPWRIKVDIIRGISDEDDANLQDMWSRLLLTSMRDDKKQKDIDRIVVDAVKRLTPQSAQLLEYTHRQFKGNRKVWRGEVVRGFAEEYNYSKVDTAMFMDYLSQVRCIQHTVDDDKNDHRTRMTTLGRMIMELTSI